MLTLTAVSFRACSGSWPIACLAEGQPPLPPQVEQIAGAQVCANPVQLQATGGTSPPPLQAGHGPLLLVVALIVVIASSHAELVTAHLVTFTR